MSIRIGSSCVMSLSMALGKVVETRRFYDGFSGWQEVAQNAIKNKQYLIVTPCNHNDKTVKYLNNTQWVNFIDDTCKYLISIGANRYNARISLINEPMKYISREKYADLINLAYPIVKSYGLLCGAGNEEFVTAQARDNMYQYILTNCQFDILDIHIQGSCNSKADTDKWIDEVKSWINYWQKPVDCTEAFYGDIRTQAGYDLLCYQLKKADEIKCPNFCNVFNNLDKSAFPYQDSTDQWHKLCFKINGKMILLSSSDILSRGTPNSCFTKPSGLTTGITITICLCLVSAPSSETSQSSKLVTAGTTPSSSPCLKPIMTAISFTSSGTSLSVI